MNAVRYFLVTLALVLSITVASAQEFKLFRSRDPLAPRDSWGLLHRSAVLNETDFERREGLRFFYYSKSRQDLAQDRAYIGAVQVALERTGFYCGPIDGVLSDEVSDAIARLQKAHGHRVNGALTVSVRRALFLP